MLRPFIMPVSTVTLQEKNVEGSVSQVYVTTKSSVMLD